MLWNAFTNPNALACIQLLCYALKCIEIMTKQIKSFQTPCHYCDMCVCVVINALKCVEMCWNALEIHWNGMNMVCHALKCVEIIRNVMLWFVWKYKCFEIIWTVLNYLEIIGMYSCNSVGLLWHGLTRFHAFWNVLKWFEMHWNVWNALKWLDMFWNALKWFKMLELPCHALKCCGMHRNA